VATLTQQQLDELRDDFDFNDADHDGRINHDEFVELIELLDENMDAASLRVGFREIDTDHDGTITFAEFVDWWTTE
jgi:Ca2+-binding EF-hand superfamily protein